MSESNAHLAIARRRSLGNISQNLVFNSTPFSLMRLEIFIYDLYDQSMTIVRSLLATIICPLVMCLRIAYMLTTCTCN